MTPLKLIINNFLSFEHTVINLDNKGLVAVQGENLDGTGASSNGSGKSSLFIAILWCLYGETDKDISADDVVNSKAGKNCSVETIWYDPQTDQTISIIRYRNHSKHKNKLTISIDGKSETMGTNVLTQNLVNKTIGADAITFKANCFASQENSIDIPAMTDKELKSLLENSLPFEKIEPLYKKYKEELSVMESQISKKEKSLAELEWSQECDLKTLEEAKREEAKWLLSFDDNKEKLKTLVERLKTYESKYLIPTDLEAQKASLEAQIAALGLDRLPPLEFAVRASVAKIEAFKKARVGDDKKCPTCHQLFATEKERQEYEEKFIKEVREEKANLTGLRTKLEALEENKKSFDILSRKLINAKEGISINNDIKYHIDLLSKEIDFIVGQLKSTENPFDRIKSDYYDKTVERGPKISELFDEIKELKESATVYHAIVDTFSPSGFKYNLLETIAPRLNDRTNYYLSMLSDGELSAIWSTVTKTATGFKEAFSIKAAMKGRVGFGKLSGGQKKKVRLACWFALQDLIADRAEKEIKLWICDEVDGALDNAGIERLMSLLEEKARDKGTVLVISHNSMRDWIANTITVTMSDDISKVSGFLNE